MRIGPNSPLTAAQIRPPGIDALSPKVIKDATAYVNKNAKSGSEDFPQFGSGNCGIAAGIIAGKDALKLVDTIRKGLQSFSRPGSPNYEMLKPGVFDPAKQALIVVANSEDEVHLHLSTIDLATGKTRALGMINTVDQSTDEKDGYELMSELLRSAKVLKTKETDHGVSGLFPEQP